MQKVTPFKKIFFSFFIVIVFFVFIELLSRAFIFFTTKKIESFSYGFNNNIQININHLIKLKINVTTRGMNALGYDIKDAKEFKAPVAPEVVVT